MFEKSHQSEPKLSKDPIIENAKEQEDQENEEEELLNRIVIHAEKAETEKQVLTTSFNSAKLRQKILISSKYLSSVLDGNFEGF